MLDVTFRPTLFSVKKQRLIIDEQSLEYKGKRILLQDVTQIAFGEIQQMKYQRKTNRRSYIFLATPDARISLRFHSLGWIKPTRNEVRGLFEKIIAELERPVLDRLSKEWGKTLETGKEIKIGNLLLGHNGMRKGQLLFPRKDIRTSLQNGDLLLSEKNSPLPFAKLNLIRTWNAVVLMHFLQN